MGRLKTAIKKHHPLTRLIIAMRHFIYRLRFSFFSFLNRFLYGELFFVNNDKNYSFRKDGKHSRIAIQVHLFYLSLIKEVIRYTNNMPENFDIYVSTDSSVKAKRIFKAMKKESKASGIFVAVYPNRGRDVGPFLSQMKDHITDYRYLCHIHTKKSKHIEKGDAWRHYLYEGLLGSSEKIKNTLLTMDTDASVGIAYPPAYSPVVPSLDPCSDANMPLVKKKFEEWGLSVDFGDVLEYPSGDMFWVKTDAVYQLFKDCDLSDFPLEKGQLDKTEAHVIERCWYYLAKGNGYQKLNL